MRRPTRNILIILFVLPLLQGCFYLAQSLNGHLEVLHAREDVEALRISPDTPADLRAQMDVAAEIRQFAIDALSLPDNASYRTYVDLERDYVTIAIFATPEFSLAPKQWCFPIFGCVPYRAHFSIDVARKEVNQLREEGYDVHVSGVTAYSTLGWSPDPLLNTMFTYGDTNAAAVVFHELAHQQLYVPSDAAFNEAFAVAVEIEGVSAWLRSQGDEKALLDYLAGLERRTDFVNLITETREELFQIYQSQKADAGKRAQKAEAIERFRARYRTVRDTKWNGFRGYDNWFDSEINNAKLGAAGLYNDLVPELRKLFDVCGREFARFYEAAERLAKLGADARKAGLKSASSC